MKHILMTVVCAAVLAANADTVAWWHLDELANGVKATNGTAPFLNSVNTNKHAGLARATPLVNGDWQVSSDYMPEGVTAFPDGGCVYDPVSGQQSENRLGVAFRAKPATSRNTGPAIVIPYDEELCPRNCTYEFFFKPEPKSFLNLQYLIFTRDPETNGLTNCGFRVRYSTNDTGTDGKIGLDLYERGPNGFSTNHKAVVTGYLGGVGKWHHVAFTMDNDAKKAQLFVDYALIGSVNLVGDCSKSAKEYVLGNAKGAGWGACEGCIDEFRISDRVLAPSEFLAVTDDGPPLMLPETVVYQRFRAFPDFFGAGSVLTNSARIIMNEVTGSGSLGQPTFTTYGDGFFPIDDVPVSNVLTGKVGNALSANRSALACRSTETSRQDMGGSNHNLPMSCPCWKFTDAGAAVSTGDMTAEMFFRTTNITYTTYFFCLGKPAYLVIARGVNGGITVNNTIVVTDRISDGQWHHLALVADGTTGTAQLYLDYVPRGDPVARGSGTYESCIGVGGYGSVNFVTFFDVDFDDVRITRKKLAVNEFLHFAKTDDVIANWNLDQTPADFAQRWIERWNIATNWTQATTTSVAYDQSDKPGTEVADGLFAERTENVSSRHVVGGSAKAGSGYYTLSGSAIASLPSDDFTVEFEAKFPEDDYVNYTGVNDAYIVTHPRTGTTEPMWQIGFKPSGGLLRFATGYDGFATCEPNEWMDGEWHHFAIVHDSVRNELRAYRDHALVGTKTEASLPSEALDKLYLGAGSAFSWGTTFGVHSWWIDNFRITKKALRPCDFKTSHFLTGNTLVWAPFDRSGDLISEIGLKPTFSGEAWTSGAGRLVDAAGEFVRVGNPGAFSAASGAGAYSRLSLIELPDVSVEFFVRFNGAVADDADIVKLGGNDGAPIWSVQKKSDGKLHVMAKPQGGALTDLGAFADVCTDGLWRHVAVTFVPSSDGSSTSVSAWLDHEPVGALNSLAGVLAVEGLTDSSLVCGDFNGGVDELRITKGELDVADMLYVKPIGFKFILR